MNPLPRILCVDDEPNILESMRRVLRGDFELQTASGGRAAVKMLQDDGPYAVVVSDLRMPELDGVSLLRYAAERCPDTVRVLLTGHADLESAAAAVNDAGIFRFLLKPCAPPLLNSAVAAALGQHRLLTAERELLDGTLRGSIRALIDLVALVHPAVVGRASRVRRISREIADRLKAEPRWAIEVGALMAHIGIVTLPATTVGKLHRGEALTAEEERLAQGIPEVAARLVARIPRLEAVQAMLRFHTTHFDGAGSPDPAVRGEALPLGARVLKAASDFDALETRGATAAAALDEMTAREGWYDPTVLGALRRAQGSAAGEIATTVRLTELRVGMVFDEDVVNPNGLLLVARGQEVTASLLERIGKYWDRDFLAGNVAVRRADSGDGERAAA